MADMRQACLMASISIAIGASAPAAAQPPPQSRDFAQAAAASDAFEILEGQTAAVQSQDPRVRAFAQQMIQDHMRTSQALMQAVMKSGLPQPPMGLNQDQSHLLYGLQSLKGPEFDRLYATQQALAHQEAVTTIQGYAARGSDPNLKQAAMAALPLIQHHLEMAMQLRGALER